MWTRHWKEWCHLSKCLEKMPFLKDYGKYEDFSFWKSFDWPRIKYSEAVWEQIINTIRVRKQFWE